MINRKITFDNIRKEFGKFNSKQVQGFETIFNEFEKLELTDVRFLAYILATVWHETANTVQPIEEFGKGKGYKYGKKVKHSGIAYSFPDKVYYGRGFVQLTWYENYQLMSRLLGVDLLNKPELACDLKIATEILFEGMLKGASSVGDFTGKCLEMYFNSKVNDPVGARRIINGTDKANLIATYHYKFLKSINLS